MGRAQERATSHPLDPLDADEIVAVAAVVRDYDGEARCVGRGAPLRHRHAGRAGEGLPCWVGPRTERPLSREAEVVILDRRARETVEARVSLDAGAVTAWRRRNDIQPMAVVSELMEAEEAVRLHPDFQAAMARRGVTDFDTVQVDAWPAGHFGPQDETGQRLCRAVAFIRPRPGDSEWAHPVDGVIVLVDLNTLEVLRVDDHGVVPIPPEDGNFDAETAAPLRGDIAPLEITQPDGPGFTLDGRVLTWQRWQVHVGFTPREGLVLNRLSYEDGGRRRSIMHRASLSEMVVPYGDPSPTHYFKNAFDGGENGVGLAASPLTRGCDCLGEIVYLDAVMSDADGAPVVIPNAVCIHEEDVGVLWRHIEWRDGSGEVRRSRRLVISSFSAIGNYDYGFFWYLYQDGMVEFEVKLTGVLSTGAVAPGVRPEHGTLVAPGLNAMVHQHFFNFRLDLDIDGTRNAVDEVWTESAAARAGEPVRQRVPGVPAAPRQRTGGAADGRHPRRRGGGRSSIPTCTTGSVSPSATGCCREGRRSRSPSPTRRSANEPGSSATTCGSRRTGRTSAMPPVSTPTCTPAAPAFRSGRVPTGRSTARTSSSGTRSATTTSPGPRTGR